MAGWRGGGTAASGGTRKASESEVGESSKQVCSGWKHQGGISQSQMWSQCQQCQGGSWKELSLEMNQGSWSAD